MQVRYVAAPTETPQLLPSDVTTENSILFDGQALAFSRNVTVLVRSMSDDFSPGPTLTL